jgi:hypothetical protein
MPAQDVAGYLQNGRDGRVGNGSNGLGHNVEIETFCAPIIGRMKRTAMPLK